MTEKQWKFMPEAGIAIEKPAFKWVSCNTPTETQTNLQQPANEVRTYSNAVDLLVTRLLSEKASSHISTPIYKPKKSNVNLLEPLNVDEDFSFSIFFAPEKTSASSNSVLLSSNVDALESGDFFYRKL